MSMNLHVVNHNPPVQLFQTPTWISYLIYSADEDGNPHGGMEAVRERYIMWLRHERQSLFNKAAGDSEAQDYVCSVYDEQISLVEKLEKPEFDIW